MKRMSSRERDGGRSLHRVALAFLVLVGVPLRAQQGSNPFANAPVQHERERQFHVSHRSLRLKVDWAHKSFRGTVEYKVTPLRSGLREVEFDAGPAIHIGACRIGDAPAPFRHAGDKLAITPPAPPAEGRELTVSIQFDCAPKPGQATSDAQGFHWVLPDKFQPERKPGFWTNGWPEMNHTWLPSYDYPNDRATSDVYVEVPSAWYVLGNGRLEDDSHGDGPTPPGTQQAASLRADGTATRLYHWKLDRPHSTYLLSLAGGEMDVVHQKAAGTEFIYAVPKGEGGLIPATFRHTPDMVQFYSSTLGVPYPWPKYGQSAVFDFIFGGMENISATTLTENGLVDARDGERGADSLVAHELAHQWFGDLVTYRDWSQAWISEGFATFFTMLYMEHSRGKDAYDREREQALQAYLNESRRYKRPIVTNRYPNPDSMLDAHTYPKGALVLHMLRRELGDAEFFRALGYYLRKHACQVVDTHDFARAVQESSKRDIEPFVDQWVYKPGHPVLSYSWTYDEAARQVKLTVEQKQDPSGGTPIYNLRLPVGLIAGGKMTTASVTLNQVRQQFTIPSAGSPSAVLIDPAHDLLMERGAYSFQAGEAAAVLHAAPNSVDRRIAMQSLLVGAPGADTVAVVLREAEASGSAPLIEETLGELTGKRIEPLRPAYRRLMGNADPGIRAAAIRALGALAAEPADSALLVRLVNERESYAVVTAAMGVLAGWDATGNLEIFRQALAQPSRHELVRVAALDAIARAKGEGASALLAEWCAPGKPRAVRRAAIEGLRGRDEAAAKSALSRLERDEDPQIASAVRRR